jgi:hypothetical protein
MSTVSIESIGWLWRCKWLQMAEESEEATSPVQRGKFWNRLNNNMTLVYFG